MTAGLDDQAFDHLLVWMVVLTTLAAIAVMVWPLDEQPRFRWWRATPGLRRRRPTRRSPARAVRQRTSPARKHCT